jgi:hypothetical protein
MLKLGLFYSIFSSVCSSTTTVITTYQWTITACLIVNIIQCQILRFITYFINKIFFQMLKFHLKVDYVLSMKYARIFIVVSQATICFAVNSIIVNLFSIFKEKIVVSLNSRKSDVEKVCFSCFPWNHQKQYGRTYYR